MTDSPQQSAGLDRRTAEPTTLRRVRITNVLTLTFLVLATLGCEISPVVSTPMDAPGVRYSDCERAAEEYCEYKVRAASAEMDACVAEHRFECVSSGASAATVPRS